MEGKSLSALTRRIIAIAAYVAIPSAVYAQNNQSFVMSGAFLEAPQFTTVKSLSDRTLRLQMGYGADLVGSEALRFGLEGLVWSRLRALSDFRFPVETADYFFGIYGRFSDGMSQGERRWRVRLSHISSHLVDGTADTTVGGSSSHYSREFVSLEREFRLEFGSLPVHASAGLRYVFHQVTTVEPALQVPIVVELSLLPVVFGSNESASHSLLLTFTTANDPSGPSLGGALTFRSELIGVTSDLFVAWRQGPSASGNYAETRVSEWELGLRMEPKF